MALALRGMIVAVVLSLIQACTPANTRQPQRATPTVASTSAATAEQRPSDIGLPAPGRSDEAQPPVAAEQSPPAPTGNLDDQHQPPRPSIKPSPAQAPPEAPIAAAATVKAKPLSQAAGSRKTLSGAEQAGLGVNTTDDEAAAPTAMAIKPQQNSASPDRAEAAAPAKKMATPADNTSPSSPPAATADSAGQVEPIAPLAMATPSMPAKPEPLTLAALPLQFGREWTLDRRPNPLTRKTECLLASRTSKLFDGYDTTELQVFMTASSIYARSDSNIDLSYPATGLRIDQGSLQAFDRLITASGVTHDIGDLNDSSFIAGMKGGDQLFVNLGFWPTWPVTETRTVSFSLDHIETALDALQACQNM